MQLEIGMSTSRYFPPTGTAGFERCCVNGKSRVPAPPPRITASKLCFTAILVHRIFFDRRPESRIDVKRNHYQEFWTRALQSGISTPERDRRLLYCRLLP